MEAKTATARSKPANNEETFSMLRKTVDGIQKGKNLNSKRIGKPQLTLTIRMLGELWEKPSGLPSEPGEFHRIGSDTYFLSKLYNRLNDGNMNVTTAEFRRLIKIYKTHNRQTESKSAKK